MSIVSLYHYREWELCHVPRAHDVDVLPPATRHGVLGTVICSKGYRRLQELDGERKRQSIYPGSGPRLWSSNSPMRCRSGG